MVEKISHHHQEMRVDGQVMGYIRHGAGEVGVIRPRDKSWSVKPPNQPLCRRDANDVEFVPRKRTRNKKPKI